MRDGTNKMSLFTINIHANDEKLSEILLKLKHLEEKLMALVTKAEYEQIVLELAAQVSEVKTLSEGINLQLDKVFDEVVKLRDENGVVDIESLMNLKAAMVDNIDLMKNVTAKGTSIDELNPDIVSPPEA